MAAGLTNEPLVPSASSITRSITYPTMFFASEAVAHNTQTLTWYANGTTTVSDSRGYSYSISVPLAQDASFALFQNSTLIDQKVLSPGIAYDIYWRPVKNADGIEDRFKFGIVGTSAEGTILSFKINYDQQNQYIDAKQNQFLISSKMPALIRSNNNNVNSTTSANINIYEISTTEKIISINNATSAPDGLGLDWSDAVAAGYDMQFDAATSSLVVPVGKSFNIDPTTIATTSVLNSPSSTNYYEGERRLVKIDSTLFAFYYDSSTIRYKYSPDNGATWNPSGAGNSASTGVIGNDFERWTIAQTIVGGNNRISLLYFVSSGSVTDFYAKTGTVSGTTIMWDTFPAHLFTATNDPACNFSPGPGVCAAVSAATDTSGTIYAAFRWWTGHSTNGNYKIVKTPNVSTWYVSLDTQNGISGYRFPMTLAPLSSGKMLFAYVTVESSEMRYRVFDGSSWGNVQITSGAGMATGVVKHISSASDGAQNAYVAYLTEGNSGTLKVANFTNTGSFLGFKTIDSTRSHTLPSATTSLVGSKQWIHIFTVSGGTVWDSRLLVKDFSAYHIVPVPTTVWNTWQPLSDFVSPDQLTTAINYRGVLYVENTNAITYNIDDPDHDDDPNLIGGAIWSRTSSDGHRGELQCESLNPDRCKIPIFVDSSMASLMPIQGVYQETDYAAATLSRITPYIGVFRIDNLTPGWDNQVEAAILGPDFSGRYSVWDKHFGHNHLLKVVLQINADTQTFPWGTDENCPVPSTDAVVNDLEKSLGHEMFHMMGFDHPAGNDLHSIVYNSYQCRTGWDPNEQDTEVVIKKYPAGVS